MSKGETVCIIDSIHPAGVERIGAAHDLILPEGWQNDPRLADTSVTRLS